MWGWCNGMMMRVCDHHVRTSMIIILSDDKIIIKNIMTYFFFIKQHFYRTIGQKSWTISLIDKIIK